MSLPPEKPLGPGLSGKVIYSIIGYCGASSVTAPFVGALWLGEVPLLALIQLPKLMPAMWLRKNVVMEIIKTAGFSKGSFSPDFIMARPYALMLVYLVPILFVILLRASESRVSLPNRLVFTAFVALVIDFAMTLAFGQQRNLTIY